MSIVIPELSFSSNFKNFTTSSCNTEGYSQLSYFIVAGQLGHLQIQGSADCITFYTLVDVNITSTGTPYTDKVNVTTKFIRFNINLSTNADVTCQAFFFDEGTVNVYNTIGGGVSSVTATGPLASTGGATPNISISQATSTTDGYLSHTDWSTFNNKGSISIVSGATPISVATGTTTPVVSISQATTSTDGYLSSTDWNTFNSKQAAGTYVNSVSGTAPIISSGGVTPAISLANTAVTPGSYTNTNLTVDNTGRITTCSNGNVGVTSISTTGGIQGGPITTTGTISLANTAVTPGSYTNTNLTVDNTGRITACSNGNGAGGTVTNVSGTAPVSVANGTTTPVISMPAASAIQDGYLTAANFSTFNNKGNGTVTNVTGSAPISVANGTTTPSISMPAASTIQDGYLTAANFSTFNNKGNGTVTSVASGTGLSGGPITTTGTLSIANTGVTPGSYTAPSITINAQGQLTACSSGSVVTSVSGTAPIISSGGSAPAISLANSGVSPGSYTNANVTVNSLGLVTTCTSGSIGVTSVGSGTGLTGGPITSTGTLSIANTTVTPSSYTLANLTVNAQGQLTACSNGTAVTSLTAGTGISVSAASGAVTVTNTAPDQTVALTAGSGISISGTYPNFTIASTQAAAGSYLISTQAPTALTQNAVIGTTSTNVAKTSDWANDLSGKYTYSGSAPNRFTIQVDFNGTSLTSGTQSFEVIKNGLVSTTSMFPIASWTSSGSTTSFTVTQSSSPFSMVNGDYIQLYNTGTTTSSGATISIKVTIINVSN